MNRITRMSFTKRFLIGIAALFIAVGTLAASDTPIDDPSIDQPVCHYFEFRVAGPERDAVLAEIRNFAESLKQQKGFLSLALKNMVGDSTMVKNYPPSQKGILATSYIEAFKEHRLPLFYSLFIRFDNSQNLEACQSKEWFKKAIVPHLHAYGMKDGKPVKMPVVMEYYEDLFITVAAGDRDRIYRTQDEIKQFLKNQQDAPEKGYITVENHVSIRAENTEEFNKRTGALLEVAQNTYRPAPGDDEYDEGRDPNHIGLPATIDNHFYRKAVTTEIMQSVESEGGLRKYIMHGVWQSALDHENSHLDRRFQQAAGPVGAFVVEGPVEPFYETRILVNEK